MMLKKLITIFFVVLLAGCSFADFEPTKRSIERGDYDSASFLLIRELVAQGGKLDDRESKNAQGLIQVLFNYYIQLAENKQHTLARRIRGYEGLLKLRRGLEGSYTALINSIFGEIDQTYLHKNLTEIYYDAGNSVKGRTKEDYKKRALLFDNSLKHGDYKNVRSLYRENHKKYASMQAQDDYNAALGAQKNKNEREAADLFFKAHDVYKRYGNFKDSLERGTAIDKKLLKEESLYWYQLAEKSRLEAKTRTDCLKTAELYMKSYEAYKKYGQINDAKQKADSYNKTGTVNIYLQTSVDYSREHLIKKALDRKYINFSTYQVGTADLIISIKQKYDYEKCLDEQERRPLVEYVQVKDELGQAISGIYEPLHFYEYKRVQRNCLTLNMDIKITGKKADYVRKQIKKQSEEKSLTFSDNAPAQLKSTKTGNLKSERQLLESAQNEANDYLEYYLNHLAAQLNHL